MTNNKTGILYTVLLSSETIKVKILVYRFLLQDDDVNQKEDKQIVADAVHDFLQVLCACHKYGIIFHDRSIGTSGKKHNELLQTVLEVILLL